VANPAPPPCPSEGLRRGRRNSGYGDRAVGVVT
jgi:hypothetical protein